MAIAIMPLQLCVRMRAWPWNLVHVRRGGGAPAPPGGTRPRAGAPAARPAIGLPGHGPQLAVHGATMYVELGGFVFPGTATALNRRALDYRQTGVQGTAGVGASTPIDMPQPNPAGGARAAAGPGAWAPA